VLSGIFDFKKSTKFLNMNILYRLYKFINIYIYIYIYIAKIDIMNIPLNIDDLQKMVWRKMEQMVLY